MQGRKITLGEARDSGAHALLIYCMNHYAGYGGCSHDGRLELWVALALWGDNRRLDEIPLRCSVCGSRKTDVRGDYTNLCDPRSADAGSSFAERVDAWRQANPKPR